VEPRPELEPGERVVVRAAASFRGATAASVRSTFAMGSTRQRTQAFHAWRMHAESVGFPTAGPEMWLGLTDSRLIVWGTTFMLSRPSQIKGSVPLDRLVDVAIARHGVATGLAIVLDSGQFVEVEAMRGRRLRRFGDTLRSMIDRARP
jgi:hypothetical protein